MLGTPPPPQIAGAAQLPQLSTAPHPSGYGPHSPGAHAVFVGVHVPPSPLVLVPVPQTLLPPPPQNWGAWHVPQSI
jgi:hypothetical protein